MGILSPWDVQYINAAFMAGVGPGIEVRTSSGASDDQRKAATQLAEALHTCGLSVSLSVDERKIPNGNEQGQLCITIGRQLVSSP
jgi:hypothetical protein